VIFDWNEEKNQLLKKTRGVSFEDVVEAILNDGIKDILPSNNPEKYPNQKQFVILINNYYHYVPFVEELIEGRVFLKTIIPSRKLKKKY